LCNAYKLRVELKRASVDANAKANFTLSLREYFNLLSVFILIQAHRVPRGIESIEIVNFKIGLQDLEKVLNCAKIYIRYGKSMEILNGKEISSIPAEFH